MSKVDLVKFLECYEEHPCLWDPRNKLYKNHQNRKAALSRMITDLNLHISIEELKTKIRSVRTMYAREAGKISASKKSGAGIDDVYIPTVAWFEVADRFLKSVVEGRPTKTNMVNGGENSGNRGESEASYFDDLPSGSQAKRPKKQTRKEEVEPIIQAVNALQNISQANAPDEFDAFAGHVAVQLRNMPLEEAISSQEHISSYLAQRRIKICRLCPQYASRPQSSESSGIYCAQNTSTTKQTYEDEDYLDDSFFDHVEHEEANQAEEDDVLYFYN